MTRNAPTTITTADVERLTRSLKAMPLPPEDMEVLAKALHAACPLLHRITDYRTVLSDIQGMGFLNHLHASKERKAARTASIREAISTPIQPDRIYAVRGTEGESRRTIYSYLQHQAHKQGLSLHTHSASEYGLYLYLCATPANAPAKTSSNSAPPGRGHNRQVPAWVPDLRTLQPDISL